MVLRLLLITLIAAAGVPAAALSQDTPPPTVIVPTEVCRGYFFVPVTLRPKSGFSADGRTLHFLYDTGASSTSVDPESLERVTGRKFKSGRRVTIRNATAGEITFNSLPARTANLDHLSGTLGKEIDGILAFGAFRKFLLTIDYPNWRMTLTEGRLPEPDGQEIFSAKGRDKRPWLVMDIAGHKRRILIDSGAGSSLAVEGLDELPTLAPPIAVTSSARFKRMVTSRAARLDGEVRFGPIRIANPILYDVTGSQLMGSAILKYFTVTFDQVRRRVQIVKTQDGPIEIGPVRVPGLYLVPEEDGLRVARVFEHGPAASTDLKVGDLITRIDGRPALRKGCDINPNATSVTYTRRRNGTEAEVTVPLPPMVE